MSSFFQKLLWALRRSQKEDELARELRFHLEEETEERAADGLDQAHARAAAARSLGRVSHVQESTRAAWGWTLATQFAQDVRYAFRSMGANRVFSALAVLSLALGIGANVSIFSFVDAILVRSLPVSHPESLVLLSFRTKRAEMHGRTSHDDTFVDRKVGYGDSVLSYPAFEMFATHRDIFSSVFGFQGAGRVHTLIGNRAEVLPTEYVTGNYFETLGVPPAAGRMIMPDDDQPGASPAAVVSYAFCQREFSATSSALGQTLVIKGHPFTIVGVTPPEFFGADPSALPEIYLPIRAEMLLRIDRYHPVSSDFTDPNYEWVVPMARLRDGVTREQAQAALAPQFARWMQTVNTKRNRADLPVLVIRDGSAGLNGLRYRYSKALFILLVVVALILAVACANIANLLLARAAARRREIAVRLGLGAGRARIVRQLLTESVTLAATGGALGLLFAFWGIRFLTLLVSNGEERFTLHAQFNWRLFACAALLSILTGALFGLAPALQSTRAGLLPALQRRLSTHSASIAGITLSRALMVAQIAISLALLFGAGLFLRTLSKLESVDVGFNRENLLTFDVDAPQAGHHEPEVYDFYNRLREQLAAIPGVHAATLSQMQMLGGRWSTEVTVRDAPDKSTLIMAVGPQFFNTMQIPLAAGRDFEPADIAGAAHVIAVNREFVKQYLGGRNAIGESISFPGDCPRCGALQVIGIVGDPTIGGDVREELQPAVFFPFTVPIIGATNMVYELRTAGDPLRYAGAVREVVRRTDPRLPLTEVRTQRQLIDASMAREILFARLCTAFALLALLIACVGLYAAMSYNVARRTSEIGVRMALGAQQGRVIWMVLGEVLALAAVGLAIGVSLSLSASKLLKSFLFETTTSDPLAIAVAASALLATILLAGFLPARKASQIDPMNALRHE
jgi:predicted permease